MDAAQRVNRLWKKMLDDYELPEIDPGADEALQDFINRSKRGKGEFPDFNS